MNYQLLEYLERNFNNYVSGALLADIFKQSRSNIWKEVNKIRKKGFLIDSSSKLGYKMIGYNQCITPFQIKKNAQEITDVILLDTVDSTNNYLKNHSPSLPSRTLIIADEQTGGKGRFRRSFFSPVGGVYSSLLIKQAFPLKYSNYLTMVVALSVVDTIKQLYSITPSIKWQNDVYLNGKKICGILCEGAIDIETQMYQHIIIGIGVNLTNVVFDSTLLSIASNLEAETGKKIERGLFISFLYKNLFFYLDLITKNDIRFIDTYRRYNYIIGKTIKIRGDDTLYLAKAIDDDGYLIVEDINTKQLIRNSNEVSIYEFK